MSIIKQGDKELILNPTDSVRISKGDSPKSFLSDGENCYILKKPKKRTFHDIFKNNFPSELELYKNWTVSDFRINKDKIPELKKAQLEPYVQHLSDLQFEVSFGEVIYQLIAANLFTSFEPTENYLHIDPETGEPSIISKFHDGFNEFIEKKLHAAIDHDRHTSLEWTEENTPTREELDFNENENFLLGKLYALALLTNDWDLVNTIMLSNAGCYGESNTANKIMVVDGGNKFHFGFDGLTCDETSFQNEEFTSGTAKAHPLKSYTHTLPFEGEVLLDLPRLLIPDLFSLSNPSLFKGFKEGLIEARTALINNPFCIQQAINCASQFITIDSHEPTIKRFKDRNSTLLNYSYYYPSSNGRYSLDAVLKERCYSLHRLCTRIEQGTYSAEINSDIIDRYHKAQEAKIVPETPTKMLNFFSPLGSLLQHHEPGNPLLAQRG